MMKVSSRSKIWLTALLALFISIMFTGALAEDVEPGIPAEAEALEENREATEEAALALEEEEEPDFDAEDASEDANEATGEEEQDDEAEKAQANALVQAEAEQVTAYTVQFVNYNDDPFYAVMVTEGRRVEKPFFSPLLDEHVFLYWADASDENVRGFDFNAPIKGDITLKAVYEWAAPREPLEYSEGQEFIIATPETVSNGSKVVGEREETLGGLSILIIEDSNVK